MKSSVISSAIKTTNRHKKGSVAYPIQIVLYKQHQKIKKGVKVTSIFIPGYTKSILSTEISNEPESQRLKQ